MCSKLVVQQLTGSYSVIHEQGKRFRNVLSLDLTVCSGVLFNLTLLKTCSSTSSGWIREWDFEQRVMGNGHFDVYHFKMFSEGWAVVTLKSIQTVFYLWEL